MSGFWSVFRRELEMRRSLFAVSAAMGLFVALLPSVSPHGPSRPEELRGAGAVGTVVLWGLALAVGLGVTAVGSAVAERRLAFDFRLPAGALAIWLGRLAAGLALLLGGAALVVAVPASFGADLGGGASALGHLVDAVLKGPQRVDGLLALAPLVLIAIFLVAHAASVALAGERSWLAVDFVAGLVALGGTWLAWRELGLWLAAAGRFRLLVGALALAVAGVLLASVAAALRGRSEPDRAHRALALALLGAGLLSAVAAMGYARWYTRPELAELLAGPRFEQPLGGGWTLVAGRAAGRDQVGFAFLHHAGVERTVRLGPLGVDVGRAGTTVIWAERVVPFDERAEVWTLATDRPDAAPRRSGLAWSSPPHAFALAPDGESVVALRSGARGSRLERQALADGRLLQTVPLAVCAYAFGPLRFLDAWRLQVDCAPRDVERLPTARRRYVVDLQSGAVEALGPAPVSPAPAGGDPRRD